MKRGLIAAVLIVSASTCFAQTNAPVVVPATMYQESIQIKTDDGKLMANVDVNGKITVAPGFSYDNVINILIFRMVSQNKQFADQIQNVNKIMEDAKFRASVTSQKAAEIFQLWNPPPPPPVPAVTEKKEEVKPVEKPGFWSRMFGGKKDAK